MAQLEPPVVLPAACMEQIIHQNPVQIKSIKIASGPKSIPRRNQKPSLRPKHPRLNSRRYLRSRCRSTALRL
jgi:hypothetical protein